MTTMRGRWPLSSEGAGVDLPGHAAVLADLGQGTLVGLFDQGRIGNGGQGLSRYGSGDGGEGHLGNRGNNDTRAGLADRR